MGNLVRPKVYLVGYTTVDEAGMRQYLEDTDNTAFLEHIRQARDEGLNWGEVVCSFYAKLCYNSLTEGKNLNLTGTRGIRGNLRGCFDQGHGSVFEHCSLNFVVHNCSRVYEVEQMRHRVGVAYSVLSGRYYRADELHMVPDPILQQYGILTEDEQEDVHQFLETYMRRCSARIDSLPDTGANRDLKKKLTSAVRRWLPQGRATVVGMTINLRALRHLVMLRTGRHSEWEIRLVYDQVYRLCKEKFPLLFWGAKQEMVDGLLEVTGMKLQPYDLVQPPQ